MMTEFSRFSTEYGEDTGPRVGVSRCLLGESVRYDGGHKRSTVITQSLAGCLCLLPLCPEVEAGLGVPRPPVQVVHCHDSVRVLTIDHGRDVTDELQRVVDRYALLLKSLHGLVLKSRSPSCGVQDTPWFDQAGVQQGCGPGFLLHRLALPPTFPVVDELMLEHEPTREDFVARVFRFRQSSQAGPTTR